MILHTSFTNFLCLAIVSLALWRKVCCVQEDNTRRLFYLFAPLRTVGRWGDIDDALLYYKQAERSCSESIQPYCKRVHLYRYPTVRSLNVEVVLHIFFKSVPNAQHRKILPNRLHLFPSLFYPLDCTQSIAGYLSTIAWLSFPHPETWLNFRSWIRESLVPNFVTVTVQVLQRFQQLLANFVEALDVKRRRLCRVLRAKVSRFYQLNHETVLSSMQHVSVWMWNIQLFTILYDPHAVTPVMVKHRNSSSSGDL